MASATLKKFQGMAPKVASQHLADGFAVLAQNTKLGSGDIEPFKGLLPAWTTSKAVVPLSIYRWGAIGGEDKRGYIASVEDTTPVRINIEEGNHGVNTGQRVYINGTGLSIDGGTYVITSIDADTFSLDGTTAAGASNSGNWEYLNGYWFHWGSDVNCIRGPISGDTTERTYFTGDGIPKMTYSPVAITGGGTDYPINTYDLGIPIPTISPTVNAINETGAITTASQANPIVIGSVGHNLVDGARVAIAGVVGMTELNGNDYLIELIDEDNFSLNDISGTPIDSSTYTAYVSDGTWVRDYLEVSEINKESRYYVITYVSDIGEEGAPCERTDLLTVSPGQSIDITNIPVGPLTGSYNLSNKRIYRTASSIYGADYQLVAEIPLAQTSYVDAIPTAQLQGVLPTAAYDMPPSDLHSLIALPNGGMAGASKNMLCLSEVGLPHAWPILYQKPTNYPIVGIENFGNTIVAVTEVDAHAAVGTSPAATSLEKLDIDQGCVSRRSIVSLGYSGVAYASPDGLVLIGPAGANVISENYMSRDNWQDLRPESIIGALHDAKYYGFYDNGVTQGGFIFDPKSGGFGLVYIDAYPNALFSDANTDTLYMAVSKTISGWDRDVKSLIQYQWKSKLYDAGNLINFSVARILADSYADLTFTLFADGAQIHQEAVANGQPFRLPGNLLYRTFQVQFDGSVAVKHCTIATSSGEVSVV